MSIYKQKDVNTCYEYRAPEEPIISEGDKLIRCLVDKQLNKNINLQDELSRIQHFEKPTELINETEFLSGHNNLVEFKKHTEYLHNLEELKSAGLELDEIKLYSEFQKGEETLKHKNMCSTILKEKLESIFKKLEQKTIQKERCYDTVSRHVKEIALNTKPNSLETQIFKFSTLCSSKNETNRCMDPINHLPELEKKLFGHLNNCTVPLLKKRRKKAKKYLDSEDGEDSQVIPNTNVTNHDSTTKWDLKNIPNYETHSNKTYTCRNKRKYTIINKKIVEIKSNEEMESLKKGKSVVAEFNKDCIKETYEKLTEEEIRKLPKFHNYNRGTPSKVLYIKNLPKQIKQDDLVSLFSPFDVNQRITYRLLTGKMTGQAFVTFHSTQQATDALEKVNGIVIKTKPIIIQYGKMK